MYVVFYIYTYVYIYIYIYIYKVRLGFLFTRVQMSGGKNMRSRWMSCGVNI